MIVRVDMETRKEIKKMMAKVKVIEAAVGKQRDEIRELISTLEELEDNVDDALQSLEEAADKLSELL